MERGDHRRYEELNWGIRWNVAIGTIRIQGCQATSRTWPGIQLWSHYKRGTSTPFGYALSVKTAGRGGGRINVRMRFSANRVTAVSSVSADTGRMLQAIWRLAS